MFSFDMYSEIARIRYYLNLLQTEPTEEKKSTGKDNVDSDKRVSR